MYIGLITGEYPPMQGGIADYTAILAQHLQRLDVTPSVLISRAYPHPAASTSVAVYPVVRSWGMRCWQDIEIAEAERDGARAAWLRSVVCRQSRMTRWLVAVVIGL